MEMSRFLHVVRFFFARAQFVTLPRCPDVNANHPIERNYGNSVRFLAKIPNGTATESPCYSAFRNAIDFYRLYTSKKNLNVGQGCQPSWLQRWLGMATGHSRPGSNPTLVNKFRFGTFGNSIYPSLPVSFGWDTKSRWSLLSGVYARGSKRSHQSALECVTVVDSTSHSKPPRSASMRLKTLPCSTALKWKGRSASISNGVRLMREVRLIIY